MELIIGLLIGAAIGSTGVGGGTLTAPALILLMGYEPRIAVATALVFSAAVKIWASGVYLARHQVDFSILWRLLAGGLPGTILGALALQGLRTSQANQWILLVVGATVVVSALVSLASIRKRQRETSTRLNWIPVFSLPIGLESGFSSAGTGALGTLVLFNFTALAPAMVVGTDLVFGMLVSAIGGGIHAASGSCNWDALTRLIPAGVVGSLIGARACRAVPAATLRKAVLICTAAVGVSLLWKGLEAILS
jgi:uncharacterized membrane protein YfcA